MKGRYILLALVAAAFCTTTIHANQEEISNWKQIDTKKINFIDISVVSKNNMWGLDTKGKAYQWNGASWTERIHDVPFKEMSVGNDGTVFMVDAKGRIFTERTIEQKTLVITEKSVTEPQEKPRELLVIKQTSKKKKKAARSKELVQVQDRIQTSKFNKKRKKKIAAAKDLLQSLEKQATRLHTRKGSVDEKIKKLEIKKTKVSGFMKGPIQAALNAQINALSANKMQPIEERLAFIKAEIDKQKNLLHHLEG